MKMKLKTAILVFISLLLLSCAILARTTLSNLLTGQVHFSDEYIGQMLTMDDSMKFTVFRDLRVGEKVDDKEKPAVFVVRFKFRNLGIEANKRLSLIPAPFLMGMEGFREKVWTVNEESMTFQGIYQWSSKEDAERYPESYIFGRMTKRAAPGTVKYEIIPEMDMPRYIKSHIENGARE